MWARRACIDLAACVRRIWRPSWATRSRLARSRPWGMQRRRVPSPNQRKMYGLWGRKVKVEETVSKSSSDTTKRSPLTVKTRGRALRCCSRCLRAYSGSKAPSLPAGSPAAEGAGECCSDSAEAAVDAGASTPVTEDSDAAPAGDTAGLVAPSGRRGAPGLSGEGVGWTASRKCPRESASAAVSSSSSTVSVSNASGNWSQSLSRSSSSSSSSPPPPVGLPSALEPLSAPSAPTPAAWSSLLPRRRRPSLPASSSLSSELRLAPMRFRASALRAAAAAAAERRVTPKTRPRLYESRCVAMYRAFSVSMGLSTRPVRTRMSPKILAAVMASGRSRRAAASTSRTSPGERPSNPRTLLSSVTSTPAILHSAVSRGLTRRKGRPGAGVDLRSV
mmetsp:Transcript_4054/g.16958  ORF Transcript_4054/g.16958 Transcript_4054/m.16958 type:complete len:390 (-) Transcript_4054:1638-2807(-)